MIVVRDNKRSNWYYSNFWWDVEHIQSVTAAVCMINPMLKLISYDIKTKLNVTNVGLPDTKSYKRK